MVLAPSGQISSFNFQLCNYILEHIDQSCVLIMWSNTLFTLSLTRPSPKLPSPVWPWPGEPSDLHWLGKSCIVGELSHLQLAWPGLRQILPQITYRTYEQKGSLGEGVCLHLTLAEILAETVFARLTSLARVKLAQCKQNLARPWLGHGQGASVNRV